MGKLSGLERPPAPQRAVGGVAERVAALRLPHGEPAGGDYFDVHRVELAGGDDAEVVGAATPVSQSRAGAAWPRAGDTGSKPEVAALRAADRDVEGFQRGARAWAGE